MTIRDRHAETHQLIAQGFEAIGEALVSLRYADRTTASGQRLLVLAGKLQALAGDTEDRAYLQAVMPKHLVESLLRNDACTQSDRPK